MEPSRNSRPLRHFAKHFFLASKVYHERKKAKSEIEQHLGRMRKSIIRMNLTYSDIDKLKSKIGRFMEIEADYAKFFKTDDSEAKELKSRIKALQEELNNEKEEKMRIISESSENARQLNESLSSVKSKMNQLIMEKAKRKHRLNALNQKINQKVDIHGYYHS
ncbi:hypothetical protein HYS31_04890 [Candidatus Woesearchaeota archaeon]|nr:hypothetical protein [Candidatus Woesearchaeota archaeon]